MKNIKRYSEFNIINESDYSFGYSDEYVDLISKYKIDDNYFKDLLYDITDEFGKAKFWDFIKSSTGNDLGSSGSTPVVSDDHYIYKYIELDLNSFNLDKIENFNKVARCLSTISETIEVFTKRIEEDGYILENVEIYTKARYSGVAGEGYSLPKIIQLNIKTGKIDSTDLKFAYSKFNKIFGDNYENGMDHIRELYRKGGIMVPDLDMIDADGQGMGNKGLYYIGFLLENEIVCIAKYDFTKDKFTIDYQELQRSIKEYHNGERIQN